MKTLTTKLILMIILALSAMLLSGCHPRQTSAYRKPMAMEFLTPPCDRVGPYALFLVYNRPDPGRQTDSTAAKDSLAIYLFAAYTPWRDSTMPTVRPVLKIDSVSLQTSNTTLYPEVSALPDTLIHLIDSTVPGSVLAVSCDGVSMEESLPLTIGYTASVVDGATGLVMAVNRFEHEMTSDNYTGWCALRRFYDSPFSPPPRVACFEPVAGEVRLTVCNSLGEVVQTKVHGWQLPGIHEIQWTGGAEDGDTLDSGLYFVVFEAAGFRQLGKMMLLK